MTKTSNKIKLETARLIASEKVKHVALETAAALAATTAQDILYIKTDLKEIKTMLDNKYVTKEAFDPVKKIVYGLIAIMGTTVIVAILAVIIRK